MNLRDALTMGTARLRDAGIDGASRDTQILLAHVLGLPVMRLALEPDHRLSQSDSNSFEALLNRRAGHEPVSKIIGKRQFWGREFIVTPDVLDPRPETETLISAALAGERPARLLDLGTGSGVLAITLLAEWRNTSGMATDVSQPALDVATRNAAAHGVEGRLTLTASDWFKGVQGRFDLILSNPPYIAADEMPHLSPEVRGHDPELALTPGGDGLGPYRVIAAGALAHLVPGGRLLVEIGHLQGPAVHHIFAAAGLVTPQILPDLDGRDRVVVGTAPPA